MNTSLRLAARNRYQKRTNAIEQELYEYGFTEKIPPGIISAEYLNNTYKHNTTHIYNLLLELAALRDMIASVLYEDIPIEYSDYDYSHIKKVNPTAENPVRVPWRRLRYTVDDD